MRQLLPLELRRRTELSPSAVQGGDGVWTVSCECGSLDSWVDSHLRAGERAASAAATSDCGGGSPSPDIVRIGPRSGIAKLGKGEYWQPSSPSLLLMLLAEERRVNDGLLRP